MFILNFYLVHWRLREILKGTGEMPIIKEYEIIRALDRRNGINLTKQNSITSSYTMETKQNIN